MPWVILSRSVGIAGLTTCKYKPLAAFKHVYCSSLLGYPKPSPEFFRAVENDLQLGPREILLIGDDWINDYQAATSAGWQAVHLDRTPKTHDSTLARSLRRAVEIVEPSLAVDC